MKDINKLCRLCVAESNELLSIFSTLAEILEENITTLADVYVRLTSATIIIGDGLPLNICKTCCALMHTAYIFVLKYERSFDLLNTCTAENGVIEIIDGTVLLEHDYAQGNEIKNELNAIAEKKNVAATNKLRECKGDFNAEEISAHLQSHNQPRVVKGKVRKKEESVVVRKLHACPICTSEFRANELRIHIQTHKSFKKCLSIPERTKVSASMKFYYTRNAENETVTIHKRERKLHKCLYCDVELPALDLLNHIRSNHGEYTCDKCNRVFRKVHHLTIHKINHMKERPYNCRHCGKSFTIAQNYEYHMLKHETQEFPYRCSYCGAGFYNPKHLYRHQFIHTENRTYGNKYPVFRCRFCMKSFKNKQVLQEHNCVPLERELRESFKCRKCNKVFNNGRTLRFHRINAHNEVPGNSVKRRIKTRKILCAVCGKYYTNLSIYAHMAYHKKANAQSQPHDKTKGNSVLCYICGKSYSNFYIGSHMATHNENRFLKCDECGKLLSGKQQLKQHMLVHSGKKPFVCQVCGKEFNKMYNLVVHERIHRGDRCHVCSICNKGFLEKSYLRKHMNVHEKAKKDLL